MDRYLQWQWPIYNNNYNFIYFRKWIERKGWDYSDMKNSSPNILVNDIHWSKPEPWVLPEILTLYCRCPVGISLITVTIKVQSSDSSWNMLTALLIVSSGRTPVPELHVHPRHGLHPRLQPGLHDPELGRGGGGGGGQPALPGPAPAALGSRRRLGPSRPRSQGDCRTAVPGTGVAPYSCGCHTRGWQLYKDVKI